MERKTRQARPRLEGLEERQLLSTVPADLYQHPNISSNDRRFSYRTPTGAHVIVTLYGFGNLAGSSLDANGALNLVYTGTTAQSGIVAKVVGGNGQADLASLGYGTLALRNTSGAGATPVGLVNLNQFNLISGGIINLTGQVSKLILKSAAANSEVFVREIPQVNSQAAQTTTNNVSTTQVITGVPGTTGASSGTVNSTTSASSSSAAPAASSSPTTSGTTGTGGIFGGSAGGTGGSPSGGAPTTAGATGNTAFTTTAGVGTGVGGFTTTPGLAGQGAGGATGTGGINGGLGITPGAGGSAGASFATSPGLGAGAALPGAGAGGGGGGAAGAPPVSSGATVGVSPVLTGGGASTGGAVGLPAFLSGGGAAAGGAVGLAAPSVSGTIPAVAGGASSSATNVTATTVSGTANGSASPITGFTVTGNSTTTGRGALGSATGVDVVIGRVNGGNLGSPPLKDPQIFGYDPVVNALIRFDAYSGAMLGAIPVSGMGSQIAGVAIGRNAGQLVALIGNATTVQAYDATTGAFVGQFGLGSTLQGQGWTISGLASTETQTVVTLAMPGTPNTTGAAQLINLNRSLATGQLVPAGSAANPSPLFVPQQEFNFSGGATGLAGSQAVFQTGSGFFDVFQPNLTQYGIMELSTAGNRLAELGRSAVPGSIVPGSTASYINTGPQGIAGGDPIQALGSIDSDLALIVDNQNDVAKLNPTTFQKEGTVRLQDPNRLVGLSESFHPELVDAVLVQSFGALRSFHSLDANGLVINNTPGSNGGQGISLVEINKASNTEVIGRPLSHVRIPIRQNVVLVSALPRIDVTSYPRNIFNRNGVAEVTLPVQGPLSLP